MAVSLLVVAAAEFCSATDFTAPSVGQSGPVPKELKKKFYACILLGQTQGQQATLQCLRSLLTCQGVQVSCADGYGPACVNGQMTCKPMGGSSGGRGLPCDGSVHLSCADGYGPACVNGQMTCKPMGGSSGGRGLPCDGSVHLSCADGYRPACVNGQMKCVAIGY
jgi:hypothetical protein